MTRIIVATLTNWVGTVVVLWGLQRFLQHGEIGLPGLLITIGLTLLVPNPMLGVE